MSRDVDERTGEVAGACDHKWVHLETVRWTDDSGGYNTHFFRMDRFYCEKCLERRNEQQDGYSRYTPNWYRSER